MAKVGGKGSNSSCFGCFWNSCSPVLDRIQEREREREREREEGQEEDKKSEKERVTHLLS